MSDEEYLTKLKTELRADLDLIMDNKDKITDYVGISIDDLKELVSTFRFWLSNTNFIGLEKERLAFTHGQFNNPTMISMHRCVRAALYTERQPDMYLAMKSQYLSRFPFLMGLPLNEDFVSGGKKPPLSFYDGTTDQWGVPLEKSKTKIGELYRLRKVKNKARMKAKQTKKTRRTKKVPGTPKQRKEYWDGVAKQHKEIVSKRAELVKQADEKEAEELKRMKEIRDGDKTQIHGNWTT